MNLPAGYAWLVRPILQSRAARYALSIWHFSLSGISLATTIQLTPIGASFLICHMSKRILLSA